MDQQNQNPQVPPISRPPFPEQNAPIGNGHRKVGPIISILIIVIILIAAAIYLYASRTNTQNPYTNGTSAPLETTNPNALNPNSSVPTSQSSNSQTVQPVTNNSDDLQSMSADLNSSTNGLDSQNF